MDIEAGLDTTMKNLYQESNSVHPARSLYRANQATTQSAFAEFSVTLICSSISVTDIKICPHVSVPYIHMHSPRAAKTSLEETASKPFSHTAMRAAGFRHILIIYKCVTLNTSAPGDSSVS